MTDPVPEVKQRQRITRVYTKVGDGGTTHLVGGARVPKNHPRLAAYGTVDELQVALGAARDALTAPAGPVASPLNLYAEHLTFVQNMLFTLGGDLATRAEDRHPQMPLVRPADVEYVESLIDALNDPLPPLRDFVLPGGHPAVTALHQCRVVCRRAEREIETLAQLEPVGDWTRPLVNRLSDLFFVMARAVGARLHRHGLNREEKIWQRDLPAPPLPNAQDDAT